MKVNGSVGRQALSSLTYPPNASPPSVFSFHFTIEETLNNKT